MRRIRLKTAAASWAIDCALRLALRFTPIPLVPHGVGRVCLRLWLQTIFDDYVLALRRHHTFVVVLARFTPLSPRHLRLPFRLVRTGIRSPASNRHTAAIRHHPPSHRGLMNARSLARGTRFIFRRGQDVGGFDCRPLPERGLRYGFRPLIPSVACIPVIAGSEHFWPRLRCSPLRLKTASAFGSIDCCLHSLQSSVTSLASCGFTTASTPCGHKLSSHFHSHFSPDTSGCAYGVGFVPITVCPETSACFSEPSMTCCRAPSSISHLCHTDSRAPPTHRGRSRLHSTPSARSSPSIVCDAHIIRPCRAERI